MSHGVGNEFAVAVQTKTTRGPGRVKSHLKGLKLAADAPRFTSTTTFVVAAGRLTLTKGSIWEK